MTIDECARTLTEYMVRNEPVPPDTLSYTIGTLQALVQSERTLLETAISQTDKRCATGVHDPTSEADNATRNITYIAGP